MAVPSSGSLSLAGIGLETKSSAYSTSATGQTSLQTIATETTFNTNSESTPDGEIPYAMSEWYGYDHDAVGAFADDQAVSRATTTGASHSIKFVDSSDTFNFTTTTPWTISFWIKAGWSNTLNTNIHFIIGHKNNATYQLSDMVKIIYNESNNRIECRYGNKTTSSDAWYKQGGWLFHANSGVYAAGYAAAGLGSTYWSSSNRGYTGDDDFTLITITKTSTAAASSLNLYWNANDAGAAPIQTNSGSESVAMSTTNDRLWSIGSNGEYGTTNQGKAGNNSATVYNDLTIWNKALSSSEVTELYNSGARMDAQTHSASSNLIGYWKFEGDGNATVSSHNFTVGGNSSIVNV